MKSPQRQPTASGDAAVVAAPVVPTASLIAPVREPQDVCAFLTLSRSESTETLRKEYLQSVAERLAPKDLATISWLLELADGKSGPSSPEIFTMMGLDDSGMILGRKLPDYLHPGGSVTLLEEARSLDPGNGAIDLYLASIYQRRGDAERADRYLDRGLRAERFDIYMPRLMRQLLAAPQTPVAFLKAVSLFSTMPIPDLNPLRDYLRAKSQDPRFGTAVFEFAQGLVDEAMESRTPYNHLDWWLGSYVMGANVLALRGDTSPRAFDLHKEFGRFPDIPSPSMEEPCNSAELERSIREFQAQLRN